MKLRVRGGHGDVALGVRPRASHDAVVGNERRRPSPSGFAMLREELAQPRREPYGFRHPRAVAASAGIFDIDEKRSIAQAPDEVRAGERAGFVMGQDVGLSEILKLRQLERAVDEAPGKEPGLALLE